MKLGNNKKYEVNDSRKHEEWNLNKWITTDTMQFESVIIMFTIWSSCMAVWWERDMNAEEAS